MQQGSLVELEIVDLNSRGDGVGHLDGLAVFVADTVPGDLVLIRLLKHQRRYATAKVQQLLRASPHRIRPRCIVADKCGGCQWQHIANNYQKKAKEEQISAALERIGEFSRTLIAPILFNELELGYRNKATYPLGRSATGKVQAGYYRRHSHRLVNLNQCPVQDARLNPLLAGVKQDIQEREWSIYDETRHQGRLRHLSLRIGRRTGETLLTLVSTTRDLPGLQEQAESWLEIYPQLMGVALNHNPEKTNAIFGQETRTVAGQAYVREMFAGVDIYLRPDTFFQVNTEMAEVLLKTISQQLNLQGTELLLDAYCGVGTFTLPLARKVKKAIGIEVYPASLAQAEFNAKQNGINNVTWIREKVETALVQLGIVPDIVLLDPPRQGCNVKAITALLQMKPSRIVYISCNPATLARDLKQLCQRGNYRLMLVQPVDFFPQTAHVETVAFLEG